MKMNKKRLIGYLFVMVSAGCIHAQEKKGQHELMPIPQREMDLCTQFNQNPKW
jgi:hypothetical protein